MTPARLREIIGRLDLSVSEAAVRLGIHRVTLHKWLRGSTPISAASAALINANMVKAV